MELLKIQYRCSGVRFQLWALTGGPFRVAARLLGLWVRNPVWECMSISCDCCTQSSRELLQNVVCLSVIEESRRKGLGPLPPSCLEKRLSGGFPVSVVTKLITPHPWSVSFGCPSLGQTESAPCSLNSVQFCMW